MSEIFDFIQRVDMSETEQALMIQENQTVHTDSVFYFLKEHKGWRNGKIHLAMAPSGAGKSTMVRSLIWDWLINSQAYEKCFVWLSEESADDFKHEFAKLRLPRELTSRLLIGSEQDTDGDVNHKKLLFAEALKTVIPSIVFFDNVTTSQFYAGKKPEEQASFAMYIKRKCKTEDIPFVIIAHSGGGIQMGNRLLELNDIRGGKDIVNLAEFAYIMQRFRVVDPMTNKEIYYPTIRILKHRGYTCENLLFKLRFNRETVTFMEDKIIPWTEFKEAFKSQLTL